MKVTAKEWRTNHMEAMLRKLRLESQKENNAGKLLLVSDDVLDTKEFTFSPIKPGNRVGDSGNLLLAKRRNDKKERYLVKHEFCDCAANEFVYSKLARGMGLRIPEVKLFRLSDGEKRRISKTGYMAGIQYLDVKEEAPSYDRIRQCARNWEDFHSFLALYNLFLEDDSFEVLLASDSYIYRVDMTSAFIFGELELSKVGLDIEVSGINVQSYVQQRMREKMEMDFWQYIRLEDRLKVHLERYGEESKKGFLRPFYKIQEISDEYIEDFLNTLCYFYPDFVGDCYHGFIHAAQKKAGEFLNSLG